MPLIPTVAVYSLISISLVGALWIMNRQRRQRFIALYSSQFQPEDLDQERLSEWEHINQTEFNEGFWRVVFLAYLFFHYPGFVVAAILSFLRGGELLSNLIVIFGSAAFWGIIGYFVFWRGGS